MRQHRDYNRAQRAIEQLTDTSATWSEENGWRAENTAALPAEFEFAVADLENWLDVNYPDGPPAK